MSSFAALTRYGLSLSAAIAEFGNPLTCMLFQ